MRRLRNAVELKHHPVRGYPAIFRVILVIAGLYLAYIFVAY